MDNTTLKQILKDELTAYTGTGVKSLAYPLFDDVHQTYGVNVVDFPVRQNPADLVIFTRVVDDQILIEEDLTDKPIFERLLAQGVPREQIILIYEGEAYPPSVLATYADVVV